MNRSNGYVARDAVARMVELFSPIIDSEGMKVRYPSTSNGSRVDAELAVTAPDGRRFTLLLEVEPNGDRGLTRTIDRLRNYSVQSASDKSVVLCAPYFSRTNQNSLAEAGINYVDSTGNVSLTLRSPFIRIEKQGASKNPFRKQGRLRDTLIGDAPARLMKTLIESQERRWRTADLISLSGVSNGAGYRVLNLLEKDGLLTKIRQGEIEVAPWEDLLRRWADDYSFEKLPAITKWVAPRGLEAVMKVLPTLDKETYSVTSTAAIEKDQRYAPIALLQIFSKDLSLLEQKLRLRPAEKGRVPNVWIVDTGQEWPYRGSTVNSEGISIVSPVQAAIDMLNGPGRNPDEAEVLLDWMRSDTKQWQADMRKREVYAQ